MEDLAVVCGVHSGGEDLEDCIGVVERRRRRRRRRSAGGGGIDKEDVAFIRGLTATLGVEDGFFGHENVVIFLGGFEKRLIDLLEGRDGLDGLDGGFELEEFGIVLIGQVGGCVGRHNCGGSKEEEGEEEEEKKGNNLIRRNTLMKAPTYKKKEKVEKKETWRVSMWGS